MSNKSLKAEWPKGCAVCKRKYDNEQWESLDYCGIMGDDPVLELRNCSCGNTISQIMSMEVFDVK